MKPFEKATWETNPAKREALIKQAMRTYPTWTEAQAGKFIDDTFTDRVYLNDVYQVSVREFTLPDWGGEWVHLSIRRIDRETIHDWRDMQEIKNLLVGPENEALELYPAESRRVDTANQYHLWALKKAGAKIPIGFSERLVLDADEHDPATSAKQRPFGKTLQTVDEAKIVRRLLAEIAAPGVRKWLERRFTECDIYDDLQVWHEGEHDTAIKEFSIMADWYESITGERPFKMKGEG